MHMDIGRGPVWAWWATGLAGGGHRLGDEAIPNVRPLPRDMLGSVRLQRRGMACDGGQAAENSKPRLSHGDELNLAAGSGRLAAARSGEPPPRVGSSPQGVQAASVRPVRPRRGVLSRCLASESVRSSLRKQASTHA